MCMCACACVHTRVYIVWVCVCVSMHVWVCACVCTHVGVCTHAYMPPSLVCVSAASGSQRLPESDEAVTGT